MPRDLARSVDFSWSAAVVQAKSPVQEMSIDFPSDLWACAMSAVMTLKVPVREGLTLDILSLGALVVRLDPDLPRLATHKGLLDRQDESSPNSSVDH